MTETGREMVKRHNKEWLEMRACQGKEKEALDKQQNEEQAALIQRHNKEGAERGK